jgi:hypothetical protein
VAKRKLKVFRTPIGFHDAYVAAPSRKAALEAWGSDTDLFSAGIAEEVTELSGKAAKAALATPGEVVRKARQSPKEEGSHPARPEGRKPPRERSPKPSKAGLEKAEKALAELESRQAAERAELTVEEQKLAGKRRSLEERHRKAREKAEAKRDAASERYREAMADWIG